MTLDPRVLRAIGRAAAEHGSATGSRLGAMRVGLSSEAGACADVILRTLADQLVRFFPVMVARDQRSRDALIRAADIAGVPPPTFTDTADIDIVIGNPRPDVIDRTLFAGAESSTAHVARTGPQPCGRPGLGAVAAGYLVMLELLKAALEGMFDGDVEPIVELHWSALRLAPAQPAEAPGIERLELGHVVWMGAGAIAHGAFASLAALPEVVGSITLVDPDIYGTTAQARYVGVAVASLGRPTVHVVAEGLQSAHPDLRIDPQQHDLDAWYVRERPDGVVPLLVTTPDSKDARRHAALKLPRTVVNAWAEGFDVGVERFPFEGGRCLGCAYPLDQVALDEVRVFHTETGLPVWRVRELLDNGALLDARDVSTVAARAAVHPSQLEGRTLRSLREHLCAVGRIAPSPRHEPESVPLGFVSGLAGVAALGELIRHRQGLAPVGDWQWDTRLAAPPLPWPTGPRPGCFICGDDDHVAVYRARWSSAAAEAA